VRLPGRLWLALAVLLAAGFARAQDTTEWIRFEKPETERIGFKDRFGKIMIEPKFLTITGASRFRNIIAVIEDDSMADFPHYHLLKDGRKVGRDSLYMFDMTMDCEYQGRIRFRDQKSDKVGFFDSTGKVVIPALYSDATPFHGGFSVVVHGRRIGDGGVECSADHPCEHWYWDGTSDLINQRNETVARGVDFEDPDGKWSVDWNSLVLDSVISDTTFRSILSNDGRRISFRDNTREFWKWYQDSLERDVAIGRSDRHLFEKVVTSKDKGWKGRNRPTRSSVNPAWSMDSPRDFLRLNQKRLLKVVQKMKLGEAKLGLDFYDLPLFLDHDEYPEYFNSCGEFDKDSHPYATLTLSSSEGLTLHSMEFLKTPAGYKLVQVQ